MKDLAEQAADFGFQIFGLLCTVFGEQLRGSMVQSGEHFVFNVCREAQEPGSGTIPLRSAGAEVATLSVSFQLELDHESKYLAVRKSAFVLRSVESSEPLIRCEFEKLKTKAPKAHWQVHAERGDFSALLARTGKPGPGKLSSLHIPVGGARMRPTLEDFCQFLIDECGVDCAHGARSELQRGRVSWVEAQVGAIVRSNPEHAAATLTSLGYAVSAPEDGHPPQTIDPGW